MAAKALASRLRRLVVWAIWSMFDALPPYRISEGLLVSKETTQEGKSVITVNAAKVEVDRMTFDLLVIGENLRVRHTRGRRAINIDRMLPGRGPG